MPEELNPYAAPATTPTSSEVDVELGEEKVYLFRSARPWGIAACIGIATTVILALAGMGLSIALLLLYDVDDVEQIDPGLEQTFLLWINIDFLVMLAVRLVTAIAFMVWTYRAYINLLALGHPNVDWKPWMAPLCWLIPFFNFIAPCLVMRELRWRSDPKAQVLGKNNSSLQTVNLWWAAWIGAIVLSWIGNQLDFAASTLADHVLATKCDVATFSALIVCGILAIWLIITIDGLQLRRYAAQLRPVQQFPVS